MAKKIDLKREVEMGVNIFKQKDAKSLFAGSVEWEDLAPFLLKVESKTARDAWRHQYRFCPLSVACSVYPSPKQMKIIEGLIGLGWDLSEELKMVGAPPIPALAALENRNVRMLKCLIKLGFDVLSPVPAIKNMFDRAEVKSGKFWFSAASSGHIAGLKNEKHPSPEEVEGFFFPGHSVDEKLLKLLHPERRVWLTKMVENDLLIKIFKKETLKGIFDVVIKEAFDDFKNSKTNSSNYGTLVILAALVKSDALGKEEKTNARKLLWAEEILQGRGCPYNRMTEVGMLWGKEEKGREFLFEVTIRNPALLKSKKLLMSDRKYLWSKLEEKVLMQKASAMSTLYSSLKNIVKREWLENNWKECPMVETVQKMASHVLDIERDPIKLGSIEEELLWFKSVSGFNQKQWSCLIERVEEKVYTAAPNGFIQKFYAVLQKDKLLDLADTTQSQKKHRTL